MPKTTKQHLPTREEFLQYIPMRGEFKWTTTSDGLVQITVPKFTSKLGKSFCKIIKRENVFTANLDPLGSLVWVQCDGRHTVQQILDTLEKKFPKQKDIDQRLFLFLQQMHQLRYLEFQ